MLASCTPHGGATTRYRVLRARVDLQFVRERTLRTVRALWRREGRAVPRSPPEAHARPSEGSGARVALGLQMCFCKVLEFRRSCSFLPEARMGLQFAGPDRRPDLLARSPPGTVACACSGQCLESGCGWMQDLGAGWPGRAGALWQRRRL